jgi:NADH:ubiquinone oxidoreductase subunit K
MIFYTLTTVNLFICFALIYFVIGLVGLLKIDKNIILFLICIEIFFLSSHLILVSSSVLLDDIRGSILSMFCLAVAGSETAIGLAIIILYYKFNNSIFVSKLNKLKG